MDVDKKQFDKAQSFVLETLQNVQKEHGATKEALQRSIIILEKEFKNAKNLDYQRSLIALIGEMSKSIEEFKKNQSQ